MLRHHGWLIFPCARTARLLALFALLVIGAAPAVAQQSDIKVTKPAAPTGEDPLLQAMRAAQTVLNDGLTTMSEETLRRAAQQYEQIILDFEGDSRYFDAVFAAAYIYMEYLQTAPDYLHAQNLLSELITRHPSNYAAVSDARLTRADLEYRCLCDYRAAQMDLSEILNTSFLSSELGDRDVQVKTQLAKCRQKLGEYPLASTIWEEVSISNPELDSEGRLQFINNVAKWMRIEDSRVRLFFQNDIPEKVYTDCWVGIHEGLVKAEAVWNLTPGPSIDVFLYSTPGSLFDYTRKSQPFALPADAEIYLSTSDLGSIDHLTGWVDTRRLNSSPDSTVFPLLRAGFQHYFMGIRSEIDKSAARAIFFYGGSLPDNEILFPLSFEYTYTNEFATMSASFLHYLVEDKGVKFSALEKLYRLLWTKPDSRYIPPVIAALMDIKSSDATIMNRQQGTLSADQVYGLFHTSLAINLQSELAGWQKSLSDNIAAVKAEIGALTTQVQKVTVDLSTPETALQSWWDAYRAGDFDALIAVSTREAAQVWKDARDLYIKQKNLEQVIIEYFIRPYRNARMEITNKGQGPGDLFVFQIKIETGSETKEMSIVIRKEGGQWKVDSN